mmetsp:Transcript_5305/g.18480  ORF Transcript_5305/g.18480 Transcript_5305/m.18480 type:complete len:236 (-) Transcript_5305:917-1624(-)
MASPASATASNTRGTGRRVRRRFGSFSTRCCIVVWRARCVTTGAFAHRRRSNSMWKVATSVDSWLPATEARLASAGMSRSESMLPPSWRSRWPSSAYPPALRMPSWLELLPLSSAASTSTTVTALSAGVAASGSPLVSVMHVSSGNATCTPPRQWMMSRGPRVMHRCVPGSAAAPLPTGAAFGLGAVSKHTRPALAAALSDSTSLDARSSQSSPLITAPAPCVYDPASAGVNAPM